MKNRLCIKEGRLCRNIIKDGINCQNCPLLCRPCCIVYGDAFAQKEHKVCMYFLEEIPIIE